MTDIDMEATMFLIFTTTLTMLVRGSPVGEYYEFGTVIPFDWKKYTNLGGQGNPYTSWIPGQKPGMEAENKNDGGFFNQFGNGQAPDFTKLFPEYSVYPGAGTQFGANGQNDYSKYWQQASGFGGGPGGNGYDVSESEKDLRKRNTDSGTEAEMGDKSTAKEESPPDGKDELTLEGNDNTKEAKNGSDSSESPDGGDESTTPGMEEGEDESTSQDIDESITRPETLDEEASLTTVEQGDEESQAENGSQSTTAPTTEDEDLVSVESDSLPVTEPMDENKPTGGRIVVEF